jgi:hypothetical protein
MNTYATSKAKTEKKISLSKTATYLIRMSYLKEVRRIRSIIINEYRIVIKRCAIENQLLKSKLKK